MSIEASSLEQLYSVCKNKSVDESCMKLILKIISLVFKQKKYEFLLNKDSVCGCLGVSTEEYENSLDKLVKLKLITINFDDDENVLVRLI